MRLGDTIAAVATAPGRSGIGVIRVSGPGACGVASGMFGLGAEFGWVARQASVMRLRDGEGRTVDQAVVTYFAGPRSYTAEDVVEVGCHGSPVVLRFCLERAVECGARLAEPGEFTLRAYLNGRIDLPRAEAVRDLIEATTLYQARVAAQQLEGSVSRRIGPVKDGLVELIALLEAGIDFAEDDIGVAPAEELLRRIGWVRGEVARLAGSFAYGKLVHAGLTLAIVGRPNVGKSSLFNRLIDQDRAIVTDIPGTTRDSISEVVSIGGLAVRFVDTAGIRVGQDVVESLGIERSYRAMADADVTLVVVDLGAGLGAEDRALVERAKGQGRYLVVGNKCDLVPAEAAGLGLGEIRVSARTGEGMEELRGRIRPAVELGEDSGFITSIRHEGLLRECLAGLDAAAGAVESGIPHEMVLLDLYGALRGLDGVTGATTADDILNRIFSTFCIGK